MNNCSVLIFQYMYTTWIQSQQKKCICNRSCECVDNRQLDIHQNRVCMLNKEEEQFNLLEYVVGV